MSLNPELLTTLLGNNGQDMRSAAINSLLDQADGDPTMKLVAQMLAQSDEEEQEEDPGEDLDFGFDFADRQPSDMEMAEEAAIRELEEIVNGVYEELEFLRGWVDTLADALGACELCWGQDPECENCHGRGISGFRKPNAALFREFVLPAVIRVRQSRSKPLEKQNITRR